MSVCSLCCKRNSIPQILKALAQVIDSMIQSIAFLRHIRDTCTSTCSISHFSDAGCLYFIGAGQPLQHVPHFCSAALPKTFPFHSQPFPMCCTRQLLGLIPQCIFFSGHNTSAPNFQNSFIKMWIGMNR